MYTIIRKLCLGLIYQLSSALIGRYRMYRRVKWINLAKNFYSKKKLNKNFRSKAYELCDQEKTQLTHSLCLYEAIPINFYIHSVSLVLVLPSPHSFSSSSPLFFFFYLNHQLFHAHNIMDIICASMIGAVCEQNKKRTFNRPSSRLLVDSAMYYCCAVPSCYNILLIHCSNYWYPSKEESLCRFIDLASVLLH